MLTVTTANVNGIRAAARKGFVEWLSDTTADVVCLQEVRATDEQVPVEVRDVDGWHMIVAPAADKGRAGVAVLSRETPARVQVGFGSEEFDVSGRYLEVDLPGVTVASLYLPSGETGTPRQDQKERFMAEFAEYLVALRKRAEADNRHVVICGDWNIAHQEIDLKNWKANKKTAGFLPEEREWMTRVFDDIGYVDVARRLHPEGPGPYSWWSYRGRAFDNDAGWRIDYHIATPGLAEAAKTAVVERAATHDARWSDHAPVTVTYAV
ncbi:exodeoxyribonuclease III [Stackebrandtia nassauensis]|uniref:Exodeoxyribonuclease III Xth n=1 Tax=Stackebrandtia nassauensis (strain DSM 44728 / CIP 108903 / NRRL B-16338 / NBRC 102104 / LLR-40K-21) TaxID=446470 RepID=D3QBL3_STANL|nr:exodeoxyribonuclease III [Stackebrandtia nassauensis]ADD42895.1 exodeoxyribonuclease III Xth [Stackebrandtia nassauensis DSM 44728]